MYQEFFGLAQAPFSIAPDPRYLFMSERHREALAHLLYAVEGGGGFVLVSGEIGAGKTTVCRCFLEQVPSHCHVAYIFNPKLSALELLQTVLQELHIQTPTPPASIKACVDALNQYLLAQHAQGRSTVLVVDEAQNLSADVLEQLRLLTNLETHEKKLLQIILIGQPELRTMLARPELEQLAQRVIARFHLQALSPSETQAYVRHRLAVAGLKGALPFDDAALARIHTLSRGVPRRINLLCDRALLGAYAQQHPRVSRKTLEKAAVEVFDLGLQPGQLASNEANWLSPGKVAAALLALGLGGGLWWQAQRVDAPAKSEEPSKPALAAAPAATPVASGVANTPTPTSTASELSKPSSPASDSAEPKADFASLLAQLPSSSAAAWAAHDGVWAWGPSERNPCAQGASQAWRCYASSKTTLAQLRQINRPGLITLYDAQGALRHALLTRLEAEHLTLALATPAGLQTLRIPTGDLAPYWRGQFAAPWALPEALRTLPRPGGSLPAPDSAAAQALQALVTNPSDATPSTEDLALRLRRFQLAQGLTPDARLGNITLMQVARSAMPEQPQLLK
jgi:general secretion pathway protein A